MLGAAPRLGRGRGQTLRVLRKRIVQRKSRSNVSSVSPAEANLYREHAKAEPPAMHADAEGSKRHDEMGFHEGWGAALDQLVALMS